MNLLNSSRSCPNRFYESLCTLRVKYRFKNSKTSPFKKGAFRINVSKTRSQTSYLGRRQNNFLWRASNSKVIIRKKIIHKKKEFIFNDFFHPFFSPSRKYLSEPLLKFSVRTSRPSFISISRMFCYLVYLFFFFFGNIIFFVELTL